MKSVIFKSLDDVGLFFMMCQSLKIIDALLLLTEHSELEWIRIENFGPKPMTNTAWKLVCFFVIAYSLWIWTHKELNKIFFSKTDFTVFTFVSFSKIKEVLNEDDLNFWTIFWTFWL